MTALATEELEQLFLDYQVRLQLGPNWTFLIKNYVIHYVIHLSLID